MATVLGLALLYCGWFDDPPIDGDVLSLNIIKDAQAANVNRYSHGELRGVVENGIVGDRSPSGRMEVHLRWDRDKVRCWSKFTNLIPTRTLDKTPPDPVTEIDTIVDPRKIIQYFPRSMTMRLDPIGVVGPYPDTVSLLPEKSWYGRGRPWTELFGPHPNFPQRKVMRYVIRKVDDDRIELVRLDQENGQVRIVSSLRDDGNVVENTSAHPSSRQSKKETYNWSRDEKGRCFLSESYSELEAFSTISKSVVKTFKRYKTLYFNPDYRPTADLFEMKALSAEPGTRLEDKIENRTRRLGERPVASVVDRLDPLIIEMKSRGFSKADR